MKKTLLFMALCFTFGISFGQIEKMVTLQKLKHRVMIDAYNHTDDPHVLKRMEPGKASKMKEIAALKITYDKAKVKSVDNNQSMLAEDTKAITDYENEVRVFDSIKLDAAKSVANKSSADISPSPTLTLPNVITGNSGNVNYIPAVSVVGGYTYVKGEINRDSDLVAGGLLFAFNSNIFTSGISQFTSAKQVFDSYWTPEASTWGINFNLNLGGSLGKNSTHTLNARIQMDLLGKKLASFDSLTGKNANKATCTSTHVKIGLEYMPFSDYLTVYFNYNVLYALTNIDTFQSYFSLKNNKAYNFVDFGIRVPYTLPALNISSGKSSGVQSGAQASTSLFVDLNFIPIMGKMSQLYPASSDKLIVTFKVGFIESFGINSNPQAAKKPSSL